MRCSEFETECLLTDFKSGDGNTFGRHDCKVANGEQ